MKLEHMGHKSKRSTGAEPWRSHTRRVNDNIELTISCFTSRGVATAVARGDGDSGGGVGGLYNSIPWL
jgi:hypothetical protein